MSIINFDCRAKNEKEIDNLSYEGLRKLRTTQLGHHLKGRHFLQLERTRETCVNKNNNNIHSEIL